MNTMTFDIPILSLTAILAVAVVYDLKYRRIPNLLTFPSMIIAVTCHSWLNGLDGFLFSSVGILTGMAVLILFYMMGGMGAGDVKLMGAVGGFLGAKGVFTAFLLTAVAGGIYAFIILGTRGHLTTILKKYGLMIKTLFVTRKFIYMPSGEAVGSIRFCYGVAIAAGTIATYFVGSII